MCEKGISSCIKATDPPQLKPLTPAITFDVNSLPEFQTHPSPASKAVVFVKDEESLIIQSANAIEREALQKAKLECKDGLSPAVYFVEATCESERVILAKAKELEDKYRKKLRQFVPPVLVPHPNKMPAAQIITETDKAVIAAKPPIPSECIGTHTYTDMEAAQLLLRRIHIRRRGTQIYKFNGMYYQALSENEFHTLILQHLRAEIGAGGFSRKIKAIAEAILAEPDILIQDNALNPSKLCLLNGMLDLHTFQLSPHTPDLFIDWQLNSTWDGGRSSCPAFDRYLQDVTGGDPTLLKRFWQATGYLLVGNSNIAKRIFILMGPSDGGKSVYGALLREFHHREQIASVDAFKLGDRFSASALAKARLNLAMDLPYGTLSEQAVGMMKSISGSDAVTVEVKYHTPYTAKLDCKLVFGTNHPIRATVADKALARRLMILPFQYPVPKSRQNPYLLQQLLSERPAILYRATVAYYELLANNYIFAGDDQFNNDAIMGISDNSKPVEDIIEEYISQYIIGAPEQFVTTSKLHESYQIFCKGRGTHCIVDRSSFSAQLRPILESKFRAKLEKRRIGGVPRNGYSGIQFLSDVAPTP